VLALFVWFVPGASVGLGGEDGARSGEPSSLTAPAIPAPGEKEKPLVGKTELEAMLKPLFKEQLEVETKAWMAYLQWKTQQISNLEVALVMKGQEIDRAEDVAAKAEDAKAAQEKAVEAKKDGAAAESTEEAQQAAAEAQKAAEEVKKAVEEAKKETEETTDAKAQEAAQKAVERAVEKTAEEAAKDAEKDGGKPPASTPATDQVQPEVKPDQFADAGDVEEGARVAKVALEKKAEVKLVLVDDIARLRDEQTAVIDRVEIVLAELDEKGGDSGEQHKYITAVRGVTVDVTDTSAVWYYALGWLTSQEGGLRWAFNIAKFVSIILLFWVLSHFVRKGVDRSLGTSRRASALMKDFVSKSARRITLVVGLVVAASALEVNVGPVLAIIGGASLVVAFALQDTLGNFASGLLILLYQPFDVGDVIDAGGVSGKVDSMNLVSTHIKTFDNKSMFVPNNTIWGGVITNATGTYQRRIDMIFGIGYADDTDKAQAILEDIVASHELVLKDPEPVIQLHELADSSVNFVCRPWVQTADYWTVYWDITREVKKRFDAEGVSIPFPQRDVHIYHESPTAELAPPE
jgi:small conductance mechanosensitive channel